MSIQEFINSHPSLSSVIFAAYFVGLWCLVSAIISFTGGWFQLSRKFKLVGPFDGVSEGLRSGQMRWRTHYGNSLRLGANGDGLFIAVLFLFRFMHPPLLIPGARSKYVGRNAGYLANTSHSRWGAIYKFRCVSAAHPRACYGTLREFTGHERPKKIDAARQLAKNRDFTNYAPAGVLS